MSNQKLKNIVEGFLFASDKALNVDHIIKMFPESERPEKEEIVEAIQIIETEFESHGIELKKVSTGYRFQVREEYSQWVSRLWEEKPQKYTRALLETLALIVYRQPITRGEIEEIRGVSVSSNIIKTLQEREWVKVVGHRDVPGRPALLASTKDFLDYFNLESLEDLPPLSEIKDLDAIATELDPEQNASLIEAIREMQEDQKTSKEESESESIDLVNETLEENPVASESESPETIADELDVVLKEEKKLEVEEGIIEATLLEQTNHMRVEENSAQDEIRSQVNDQSIDEFVEVTVDEPDNQINDNENSLQKEIENKIEEQIEESGKISNSHEDGKVGEV